MIETILIIAVTAALIVFVILIEVTDHYLGAMFSALEDRIVRMWRRRPR